MIDSHTHIHLCAARELGEGEHDADARIRAEDLVVARALDAGVRRILNIGLGGEDNHTAVAAAERYEPVYAAVGCHPTEAGRFDDAMAEEIATLAEREKVVAIGETGIDYYRDTATPAEQRRAFEAQVEIAVDLGLPIVIHARDVDGETRAIDEVFEVLGAKAGDTPVILHCFSAPSHRQEATERGWYFSFAGHLTYPGSDELREAAALVPDELVLVETDAPYLAPQSVRGQANEPAFVVETARLLSELREFSYEELERTVESNSQALFGW